MRNGILIIDGKVAFGPAKFGEVEAAYKKRVRTGEPGVIEIWSSSGSKKVKLKASAKPVETKGDEDGEGESEDPEAPAAKPKK